MSGKKYKDKVEQRTKEEKKAMKAKVAAKKQDLMSELTTDVIRTYFDEDGVGDGKLFNRLHRDKIVGVIDSDDFLFWNGAHWEKAKEKQEFRAIEDVVRLYERLAAEKEKESDSVDKRDDPDLKKELQKQLGAIRRRIKTLRDAPGQDNLKKMTARVDPPLLVYPEQLDDKPRLLPCPNGVINLETGELEQGRPRDYLLTACETEYDPGLLDVEDPCPVANDFLLRSMDGDKELVAFIWRLLGYGLIRERKDHIFMIFHGEHGRNGKDTLIKLITTTLGKALSGDVPVEMLLQTPNVKNSSGPSPDVMRLRGMCIAWINEAEENQKFALAKLKKLSGGSYITGRSPYSKEETSWKQTHLPIMTTNELPKAKADDAAFWQRALILKWNLSFVNKPDPAKPYQRQADKYLDEKLEKERKGVLARMVRGAIEYLKYGGLHVPEKVYRWTESQRTNWDDLAQFLSEWCVCEPGHERIEDYKISISATDLHEAFCLWYARYKDKRFSISAKKFSDLLNKKEIPAKRSNGIRRLGITLTPDAELEIQKVRDSNPSKTFRKNSLDTYDNIL